MTRRRLGLLLLLLLSAILGVTGTPARAALLGGVASGRFGAGAPARLDGLDAGWAYDWSATPPPDAGPAWVPMVWGAGSVTRASLATLARVHRTGRARDLLGFNEPDLGAQANLTPGRAAALWPALMRTGLTLGSPAPADPFDGWLARFMAIARARHLRVDFIDLHAYPDVTDPDAVAELRGELVAVHRRYHRPIWLTELGALDLRAWGEPMRATLTRAAVIRFVRAVVPMLRSLPWVRRVAWFTDACTDPACRLSALLTARGRLTATGRAYRSAVAGG